MTEFSAQFQANFCVCELSIPVEIKVDCLTDRAIQQQYGTVSVSVMYGGKYRYGNR
jgi:hypothetical protein